MQRGTFLYIRDEWKNIRKREKRKILGKHYIERGESVNSKKPEIRTEKKKERRRRIRKMLN